ncbi:MAG: hypothetical protein HYV60_08900 [Planctomycetia bacterium]|nr:hypothetical protein [Planctomycetia bacterium]
MTCCNGVLRFTTGSPAIRNGRDDSLVAPTSARTSDGLAVATFNAKWVRGQSGSVLPIVDGVAKNMIGVAWMM